jgi:hypothetical protein
VYPRSVAISDLDSDMDLDLAVGNSASSNVSVLLNRGDGTFGTAAAYARGGASVVISDLDGDLDRDLAVARSNNEVSVLLNQRIP